MIGPRQLVLMVASGSQSSDGNKGIMKSDKEKKDYLDTIGEVNGY